MFAEGRDQFADGGRSVVGKVPSEHVTQLDSTQLDSRRHHRRTVSHRSDNEAVNLHSRCEAGTTSVPADAETDGA